MPARERLPLALLAALIALFLIANRGAYKGYFDDDSLDNLGLSRELSVSDFTTGLLTPHFYSNNFRPVGHLYFRILGQTAGLHFPRYIFVLHAIHLLNVCLVYLLLRRFGLELLPASAGALLFAFHMAVFDVFWKPMYVFDLLCGCFCLAGLLLYLYDRWILSLIAFWLAYRAKEVVIMFPVVLAAYELILCKRRWHRLIPFFAISLWFGFQAMLKNQQRQNDYTLRFDPAGLWKSISFYSSEIFLLPYLGLAVLLLFFLKDRRIWFGLATFCLLLVPMILLPGRLFAAYLYVPLIGLAIAFAAVAARLNPALIALFFAVWLGWNYANLRWQRKAVLAQADLNRAYVTSLANFSREAPPPDTFIYDAGPVTPPAALGAIRVLYPGRAFRFCAIDDPDARTALQSRSLAILSWDPHAQSIHPVVRTPETPDVSYIKMNPDTPVWQLEDGWYEPDSAFRWTRPSATARLERPAGANEFELRVNVGPVYIQAIHRSHVEVAINGIPIGQHDFTQQGWQTVAWKVPPGPPGPVQVSLHVSPAFSETRPLGLAIGGLGFITASPEPR